MARAFLPVRPLIRDRANEHLAGMAAQGFVTTPEQAVDLAETANILRDAFVEKWGAVEPPEGHRAEWQRDLETVQWANGLEKSK